MGTDILQGENWVCEDVISEMACEILRKIAKTLKLKVEIVDKIIRDNRQGNHLSKGNLRFRSS